MKKANPESKIPGFAFFYNNSILIDFSVNP